MKGSHIAEFIDRATPPDKYKMFQTKLFPHAPDTENTLSPLNFLNLYFHTKKMQDLTDEKFHCVHQPKKYH